MTPFAVTWHRISLNTNVLKCFTDDSTILEYADIWRSWDEMHQSKGIDAVVAGWLSYNFNFVQINALRVIIFHESPAPNLETRENCTSAKTVTSEWDLWSKCKIILLINSTNAHIYVQSIHMLQKPEGAGIHCRQPLRESHNVCELSYVTLMI